MPYISKHSKRVRVEFSREKSAHRTLGLPSVPLRPPAEYLKKKSRVEHRRTDVKHEHARRPSFRCKLPSWEPVRVKIKDEPGEATKERILEGKDFRKENVLCVQRASARKPKKRYVDTRFGDSHPLEPSGLYPTYVHKKGYGSAPSIHRRRRKEREASARQLSEERRKDEERKSCRYITEEERAKLLTGMKKNWDELMKQYQCLPLLIDTLPKVQRKTKMERALHELEKDIAIIERHHYIYVYDDEDER
ncbi:hypothetical protein KM043_014540 [Ampulex compressa]|nr:hypothetical protein KM043_014540 [Ampulex compressa]